jgi:hypothetical protein
MGICASKREEPGPVAGKTELTHETRKERQGVVWNPMEEYTKSERKGLFL